MLMVLTRIGEGSKMVINGDPQQSDERGSVNGLSDAMARLRGIDGVGFCELTKEDIVRHPLIGQVLDRYVDPQAGNGNGRAMTKTATPTA